MARDPVVSVRLPVDDLQKLDRLCAALDRLTAGQVSRSEALRWLVHSAPRPVPTSLPAARSLGS